MTLSSIDSNLNDVLLRRRRDHAGALAGADRRQLRPGSHLVRRQAGGAGFFPTTTHGVPSHRKQRLGHPGGGEDPRRGDRRDAS